MVPSIRMRILPTSTSVIKSLNRRSIMGGKSLHLSYNHQINNQHNHHRSFHTHSEQVVFNGPIFGYAHHVTGKGPNGQPQDTSSRTSGHSSLNVSEENLCSEIFNGAASASLTRSFEKGEFPINRSVFEAEYPMMSREMQLYVKRLLEDYAKRDATSS